MDKSSTLHRSSQEQPFYDSVFPVFVLANQCGDDSDSRCLIGMRANDGFNNSSDSVLTTNGLYAILFALVFLTPRASLVPGFLQNTMLTHTSGNIRHSVMAFIIHCTSTSLAHCHSYGLGMFAGNMDNYHYVFGQSHTSCSSSTHRPTSLLGHACVGYLTRLGTSYSIRRCHVLRIRSDESSSQHKPSARVFGQLLALE